MLKIKVSVVSLNTLRYLGDLQFDFMSGSCGTFNVDRVPRIFLCFSKGNSGVISPDNIPDDEIKKCRMMTRTNDGFLSDIRNFKGVCSKVHELFTSGRW